MSVKKNILRNSNSSKNNSDGNRSRALKINELIELSDKDASKTFDNYISVISCLGGRFFEIYTFNLLKKYYKICNVTVDFSKLTGGSDDHGIDSIIHTTDWLGYNEKVFIQAKSRVKNHITLNETRQFYGAMCANEGTRGIIITNSTFHYEAEKYVDYVPDLIGIDKNKLYELAKFCQYGINTEGGRDWIDSTLFHELKA